MYRLAFIFAVVFLMSASYASAQFSPPKVCRTDNFEIAPLATSDKITIKRLKTSASNAEIKAGGVNTMATQKVELRVFDVYGVMKFRALLEETFEQFELNLSNYAAGVYVVEVREGCDITSSKVIRRHH